jgi:metallo-beta-lactamase family protein
MASLTFLGAARTVTGSKYLVEACGKRFLIDCGLFQGSKELRLRNWSDTPADAKNIDFVVLTHAHVDHTGSLPRLVKRGFDGPVYSTSATRDLCALLLPDSGRLQEEEAAYANKVGYTKHKPALPLYTEADAQNTLPHFECFAYERPKQLAPGITCTFRRAGHILGSAIVEFVLEENGKRTQLVFTGDLGRYDAPIIPDPEPVSTAQILVTETTYGNKTHGEIGPREALKAAVLEAEQRTGVIVIPSFAIGRTQEILYHLRSLEDAHEVPIVPVYVDSPMAVDATPIYVAHREEHDEEMRKLLDAGKSPLYSNKVHFCRSVEESKAINSVKTTAIIISASGMATGGRVLHHLEQRLPDPKNTVLFVGYQSEGTRGRRLQEGEKTVRIHGQEVPVRAQIRTVSGFSAHADFNELLRWMDNFKSAPGRIFLVHGEVSAMQSMQQKLAERKWPSELPEHNQRVEL